MGRLCLLTLLAACKPSGLVEMMPDDETEDPCDPANPQLGDIEFSGLTAEDDMVDFCATYNGILGDLTIEGDKITTVESLSCLCSVGGSVEIADTLLSISKDWRPSPKSTVLSPSPTTRSRARSSRS